MTTQHTIILDGGMGRELKRMGAPFTQPYWSAQALMDDPSCVFKAHDNFIQAGAEIITTNAYAVVPYHIGADLYAERGEELINLAGELARRAAEESGHPVGVAGCVPPVFGSYKPELFDAEKAPELLEPFFKEQSRWSDLWLAETVSSLEEAQVIYDIYKAHGEGKPFWLSLTLSEVHDDPNEPLMRTRKKLRDVLPELLETLKPEALLFNCCAVEDVLPALKIAQALLGDDSAIKLGGYANAFTNIPKPREATITSELRDDLTPEHYLDEAKKWHDTGASILGGCCGIGPDHISILHDYFKN